jgi:FixJ family two-component response regulator
MPCSKNRPWPRESNQTASGKPGAVQIAARLRINQRTVESHRALVMKKMGAKTFADLIRLALGTDPLSA